MDYNLIGFWLTVVGTTTGIISLLLAIYISRTSKKIKEKLLIMHIQKEYIRSKQSIIKELVIIYDLIKKSNVIDYWGLNERIIELKAYEKALSKKTLQLIKKLEKLLHIKGTKIGWFKKRDLNKVIGLQLYRVISRIQTDFNEKENILEVITSER